MIRATRKKKKKARRIYGLVFLIFLSAAAGVGLYKLSPSLLDISRIFRHAADKILEESADITSAEPVLRGTVFDRNLKELAVSYRLYSLFVRPAEITDMKQVVQIVADVTGQDASQLFATLNQTKNIINIAENLEQPQVDLIKNARLPGLYVKPVEERFYPEHETAAELVGFTGKGIGLAGVEGVFDMLLQEGEFLTGMISGIDFKDQKVLGNAKTDVILTIDLVLQEEIERQLKGYLEKRKASRGAALLLDPRNGRVYAWANQPSFNPNYYWQAPDAISGSLFSENLDPALLQSIRTRVAATIKQGDTGDFLLPATVANINYGLKDAEVEQFWSLIEHDEVNECALPVGGDFSEEAKGNSKKKPSAGAGNMIGLAAALSSMVNGGWSVSPFVLEAVYDHGQNFVHARLEKNGDRERQLSPSMGIKIRRDMISSYGQKQTNMILFSDAVEHTRMVNGLSRHIRQETLAAAIPEKSPEMLLLMLAQRDYLDPEPPAKKRQKVSIDEFGTNLLGTLYRIGQKSEAPEQYIASAMPKSYDKANYNQFLISSKMDFQERKAKGTGRVAVMPQLVGLSLRKGLQRLNDYHIQVKVQGSGQIVSQVPGPGEPLQDIGECVLTLDSEI